MSKSKPLIKMDITIDTPSILSGPDAVGPMCDRWRDDALKFVDSRIFRTWQTITPRGRKHYSPGPALADSLQREKFMRSTRGSGKQSVYAPAARDRGKLYAPWVALGTPWDFKGRFLNVLIKGRKRRLRPSMSGAGSNYHPGVWGSPQGKVKKNFHYWVARSMFERLARFNIMQVRRDIMKLR